MPVDQAVGIEDGELAGADATDDDVLRQGSLEPRGEGADQGVAVAVADGVVDLLEAVDVDVDEEDGFAGPRRGRRRLGDLADHCRSRHQAGQLVEMGFVEDVVGRLVDPGKERHRRQRRSQRAERRNHRPDRFARHAGDLGPQQEFQAP